MSTRSVTLLVLYLWLVGCAVADRQSDVDLTDGSIVHTLHCKEGWAGCYQSARELCAPGEFEEIHRDLDGAVTSAGHLARMHSIEGGIEDHVYSEDARTKVFDRTITIRCK